MVTTKLNLSMTEPQVRQIYAKQGDTGRVLDITLDQTPEDGTLRILRPDGVEVTSETVTGGEVESGGTFESLTEADVTELTVGIEPVQDLSHGDPSPSNICPITGHDEVTVTRTGKNLNPNEGVNFTTATSTALYLSAGTYSFSTNTGQQIGGSSQVYIQLLDSDNNNITDGNITSAHLQMNGARTLAYGGYEQSAFSFTLAVDCYLKFGFNNIYPTNFSACQIERGSTATTYEPYQGSTYTTSLGQTVYGGTLDLVSGVLTVDSRYLTVNDFPLMSSGTSAGGLHWVSVPQTYPAGVNDNSGTNVCSHAPYTTSGDGGWASRTPIYVVNASGYPVRIYVDSTTYADFQAKYATLQAVYKLAKPVTYQLTAQQIKTLIGANNVWASSGDIVSITFTYGGLLAELPSDATEIVGKCYCDVEQNGVSSMPFTLNVKKNERES